MTRILASLAAMAVLCSTSFWAQELETPAPKTDSKRVAPSDDKAAMGVQWTTDFAAAKALAAKEKKKLLICFSTASCGPCKALEKNVWSKDEVGQRVAKDFVAVKADGNKDRDLVKLYEVQAYPTVIIAEADGTQLVKQVGAGPIGRTPESAIIWLDDQLKTPGRLAALEKAHKDDPKDAIAAKKLADAYHASGRKAEAAKLYDIAEKLLDDALIDVRLKQCDSLINSKQATKALIILDEILPKMMKNKDERALDASVSLANLLARFAETKDPKRARKMMLDLVETFPDHKRVKEFRCWAMMYAHMAGDNDTAKTEAQKLVDEGPADCPYVDRCKRFVENIDRGHKYR